MQPPSFQTQLATLSHLSGLDYTEQRLVSRMLAQGIRTKGDRACLKAIAARHLTAMKKAPINGAAPTRSDF